jgi:predicted outer membrane protein
MGRIAEPRSAHPKVKEFAHQMIMENEFRTRQLRALSHEGSAGLNGRQQAVLATLRNSTDAHPMDRRYTEIQLVELQALIDHLRSFRTRLSTPFQGHADDFRARLEVYNRELQEIHNRVH